VVEEKIALAIANEPGHLARDDHEPGRIGESIRIGITKDADRLLWFYVRGSKFVSGTRALNK
jgi:DNA-3-methyladenine glycosylase